MTHSARHAAGSRSRWITDLESIDRKIKARGHRTPTVVIDRGSTLTELYGIEPSSTARLLADVGDQQRHRLSRAGNRRINRVLHIMAVVQLRNPTKGRTYFDARKAAGQGPSMEAMDSLKRRLSNVVYARLLADQKRREAAGPGGHSGTTLQSSVTGLTPDTGPSDKPQPGPTSGQPTPVTASPLT